MEPKFSYALENLARRAFQQFGSEYTDEKTGWNSPQNENKVSEYGTTRQRFSHEHHLRASASGTGQRYSSTRSSKKLILRKPTRGKKDEPVSLKININAQFNLKQDYNRSPSRAANSTSVLASSDPVASKTMQQNTNSL